jgi:hypothetical protein
MSGARHRLKGNRVERELVQLHKALGVHAERYPLSGASRFRGSGHDVDIYAFGTDEGPLVAEVKSRRSGAGFVTLEKWLGEYDCLFLSSEQLRSDGALLCVTTGPPMKLPPTTRSE